MIGTGIGLGLAGYRINPAGGPVPVLDINFRDYKTFNSAIGPNASFSRASTGTYFDETGVLRTAAINAGRINHAYNGTSWVAKGGLLEEQRTNLFLYSNDFSNAAWNKNSCSITSSATTGPDGTTSASALVEDSTTNYHDLFQRPSGGTTAGVTYTFSAFIKAAGRTTVGFYFYDGGDKYTNFNLSTGTVGTNTAGNTATITNVGNGWYRCSITRTIGTSSVNGGGYISSGGYANLSGLNATGYYIYGAQIEVGSFGSSYIDTTSSSATRSVDVMQLTGTDFSVIWNANEGTIAFDADGFSTSTNNQVVMSASSGSVSNSINLVRSNANDVTGVGSSVLTGGVVQEAMNAAAGTWPTGSSCKLAFAYKANDFAQSVNGGAVTTDTSGTIPTVTQLTIGNAGWANSPINGHIARLRYWNTRLDNATLRYLAT